ncbi:hypothetical protein [Polynucleobacter sp. MWH-UH35A]|uniref:hypothetical protein n=1 Tax=Polynucleobacter sp. MWH-UH35A TaxID=1855619 RepID=UPI001BFDD2BC|nr:hypothetical protein [Polynucleobacter sp. MWH-UH35A]QWD60449.1 hypothetical protein ICV36_01785 [Polynucleobacter sp. MWH-UH35A]
MPYKIIFIISVIGYSIAPFLYYDNNVLLIGGDDIKFEFFDPGLNIIHILSGAINNSNLSQSSLITEVSNIGYYLLIYLIDKISPINTQLSYLSLQLNLTFIGMLFLLKETAKNLRVKISFICMILLANLYALSPVLASTLMSTKLPVITYIWGMPLLMGLLLRFVRKGDKITLTISIIVLFVQSSIYASVPWTIPLLPLLAIYIFLALRENYKRAIIFLITIIINIFIINIDTLYLTFIGGLYSNGMFSIESINASKHISISTSALNSNYITLAGLPVNLFIGYYKNSSIYLNYLNIIIIIIISLFCIFQMLINKKSKKLNKFFKLIALNFIIINYLYNGFGHLNLYFSNAMENAKFLIIWRNSYDKFSIAQSISFILLMFAMYTFVTNYNDEKIK